VFPVRKVLPKQEYPVAALKEGIIAQLIPSVEHKKYEGGYAHDQTEKTDHSPAFPFDQVSDCDFEIVTIHIIIKDVPAIQTVA
jgi:hypothetical protein